MEPDVASDIVGTDIPYDQNADGMHQREAEDRPSIQDASRSSAGALAATEVSPDTRLSGPVKIKSELSKEAGAPKRVATRAMAGASFRSNSTALKVFSSHF